MRQFGQVQLEAIICFAFFLGILGVFAASLNQAGENADSALHSLKSKTETEVCCIAADSGYASNVEEISSVELLCTGNGNVVESEAKQSKCLAMEIRLVQGIGKKSLEVKQSGHYR